MYNIAQTMRPGALFLVSTGTSQCLDESGERCEVITEGEPGFRWIQKMFSAMHEAMCHFRGSPWPQPYWHKMAERNPNYADVTCQQMLLPIGNWLPTNSSVNHQYAAELTRYNIINLFKTLKHLFIRREYPEVIIDHWIEETSKELQELQLKTSAVWSWMWCRRTENSWSPSPVDTASDIQ
ncbi:hypothetical protein FRC03_009369 [Tulasnella sp. 419]|nr:hypothetical protein FRC03_009369 [Tulasnella sp. 419]